MQRFGAIDAEVFCKSPFTSQALCLGLHLGCALILTDEWGMKDEKHAIAMKQLLDTNAPTLRAMYPRVRDGSDQQKVVEDELSDSQKAG